MARGLGGLARRAQPYPRVRDQHAVGVRKQRIDLQLGDLGKVDDDLAHPHQRLRNGLDIGRRHVPELGERSRDSGTSDQRPCERQIERRQVHREVAHDLRRRPALTKQDGRSEAGIVGHTNKQLPRASDPSLDEESPSRVSRIAAAGPARFERTCRHAYRRLVREVEHQAASGCGARAAPCGAV